MSHEFKQSLKFPEHNQHQHQQQHQQQQQRLNIPLKTGGESLFLGTPGSNPGPTVSNMFNEHFSADGDFRSFSDLLMGSPAPASTGLTLVPDNWSNPNFTKPETDDESCGFKDKRPGKLVLPVQVSPVFNMSPGFSPSVFLTSPTFLSPSVSPYAMSPQQTLAQLTAQAHAALTGIQTEYHHQPSSSALPPSMTYQNPVFNTTSTQPVPDPPTALHTDRRPPTNMPINVDKPADDGYNWRKYGQKQVKGSEYPRSYYRCTSANCPVKKKVERSFDGHITEIIYKGQHNHEPPQHGRRGNKDGCLVDNGSDAQFRWSGGVGRDAESAQATSMLLNGPSDSEESGEIYQVEDEDEDEDEPKAKRSAGTGKSDVPFTHRTMTEPKIVVQTRSEVDLLDDGYRWRKYGQKVVKGNPNPRSYYKCTTVGCKVRKHVERASTDMRAVITTYEGKHNHDVPAPRGSSINNNAANNIVAQQMKLHNSVVGQVDFGNRIHTPVALRLKQEQNLV